MKKKPLNLSVNEELVKRARKYGINLSSFLEIKLQEHLALIEGKHINSSQFESHNTGYKDKEMKYMDLSGFEPEASSMPRRRSSELIYKPIGVNG